MGREFIEELPARPRSTTWHSAGEALSTVTARGRLLLASLVQMPGQYAERLLELAAVYPLMKAAMTGLGRRIFLRQFALLRSSAQNPEDDIQYGVSAMSWTAEIVLPSPGAQRRFHHLPLFFVQCPAFTHRPDRRLQSTSSMHRDAAFAETCFRSGYL